MSMYRGWEHMHVRRCLPCLHGIKHMAYNCCLTILHPNEDKAKDWGEPLTQNKTKTSDIKARRIYEVVQVECDWRVYPRRSYRQILSDFCKIPGQYQGWCRCGHFNLHPFSEVLLKAINQGQGNHMAGEMCHGCEKDLGWNPRREVALGIEQWQPNAKARCPGWPSTCSQWRTLQPHTWHT